MSFCWSIIRKLVGQETRKSVQTKVGTAHQTGDLSSPHGRGPSLNQKRISHQAYQRRFFCRKSAKDTVLKLNPPEASFESDHLAKPRDWISTKTGTAPPFVTWSLNGAFDNFFLTSFKLFFLTRHPKFGKWKHNEGNHPYAPNRFFDSCR